MANAYAKSNWQKREEQRALDAAREPIIAFYEVPREIFERVQESGGRWLDLVSAADLAGCRVERTRKRDVPAVRQGWCVLYEFAGGHIGVLAQGW